MMAKLVSEQKKVEEEFVGLEENAEIADGNDGASAVETLEEKEKIPNPYVDASVAIKHGMYGKWRYDKKADAYTFDYVGAAVYLSKTIIFAETMNRELELYFYDPQGQKITFNVSREKMTEQYISEFTRKGVQVQKKHMGILLTSILIRKRTLL